MQIWSRRHSARYVQKLSSVVQVIPNKGESTCAITCCMTRSITLGSLNLRLPPSGLSSSYLDMRYRFCSFQLMNLQSQGSYKPVLDWLSYRSPVKQISPDKNMHFLCTAASFTVTIRTHGFVVLCQLTSSLRLIWCSCSSARKFASGFLQTNPRGQALAIR